MRVYVISRVLTLSPRPYQYVIATKYLNLALPSVCPAFYAFLYVVAVIAFRVPAFVKVFAFFGCRLVVPH